MITIGKVTLNTDDAEQRPIFQSYFNGKAADTYLYQPYGLTSRPPQEDSLVAIMLQQNHAGARIGFPFCPTKRKKKLKSGEVVLENMLAGSFFYFKEDGDLEIYIPKDINAKIVRNVTITALDTTMNLNNLTVYAKDIRVVANSIAMIGAVSLDLAAPLLSITSPDIKVTGNSVVKGSVTVIGNVATVGTLTNNGVNVGSLHVHGGVQSGGGTTTAPF
jgi:hypothetical protein